MALNGSEMVILNHLIRRQGHPRILSLGYPDLLFNSTYVDYFLPDLRRANIPIRPDSDTVAKDHGRPSGSVFYDAFAFFRALGGELTVADFTDLGNRENVIDLNQHVRRFWRNRFDLIIDPGTIEHCFNVVTAMENIVLMLRTGGFVYHQDAINFPNHGFFSLSPTFFVDFYASNGFEIEQPRCWYMGAVRDSEFVRLDLVKLLKIEQSKEYRPLPGSPPAAIGVYIAQKGEDPKRAIWPSRRRRVIWPIQHKYGNNASYNIRFANWIEDAFTEHPEFLGGNVDDIERQSK
jgi:hypothetical protein